MKAAPPPAFRRRASVPGRAGFSLVEICLAVGIVAFALLPLVGLLSVGLDSYHKANMRGRAAQAVSQIASCIRLATTTAPGTYTAAAPLQTNQGAPVSWSTGKTGLNFTIYFTDTGEIVTDKTKATMVAEVVMNAPTSQFNPGMAQIAVAWPMIGDPTYDLKGQVISFVNPQGHEESTISFIPN